MEKLTSEQQVRLVKEQTGYDVVIDTPWPIVVASVSLAPFGLFGTIYVYRDEKDILRGIGVPYGFESITKQEVA